MNINDNNSRIYPADANSIWVQPGSAITADKVDFGVSTQWSLGSFVVIPIASEFAESLPRDGMIASCGYSNKDGSLPDFETIKSNHNNIVNSEDSMTIEPGLAHNI